MTHFEVFCQNCNVSFPVGKKVCLHCGGKTGPRPSELHDRDPDLRLSTAPEWQAPPPELVTPAPGTVPEPVGEEDEEAALERTPSRIVMGVVWVLLAVVGSVYRICSGG